jgi:hypothetical protein
MTCLGVVIAVSEYTGEAGNLPACRQDGMAIAHVLKSSGRFDDILHIDSEAIGTNVKQKLADFAKTHKGKEIDEVFFYFTGHGEFVGDEFYYLLTDYQAKKRNQTSLENSELDGIVRALTPKLFVKIVDACQSGVTYIKTPDDFKEYLKGADKKFEKIYFMFSSQAAQFSYQNDKISYFTESVLKSIFSHTSDKIRYKDVMSYVSDDFKERDFQTPLFVTQADFTEALCDVTASLKEKIREFLQDDQDSAPTKNEVAEELSLMAKLKRDAKSYCSKEEALSIVSSLPNILTRRTPFADIAEIFEQELHVEQNNPPASAAVGRWLDKGKDERKYFARPTREWETYQKRVPKNAFGLSGLGLAALGQGTEYTFVEEKREIISGFSPTTEMPFQYVRIRLAPKLPNLAPEECYLVPIISRTHLRLFWAFSHFEYVDWDKASRVGKLEWATNEAPLKETAAVESLIGQIETRFLAFVEEPLKARWASESEVPSPESAQDSKK